MPKHRPVPGFDPEKHGEALEAALVETRFQQTALAEQGDVDSMVLLGSMHFRGQGGPLALPAQPPAPGPPRGG